MNANAEDGGVLVTERCVLESLRETVEEAFRGETFEIRQAAVRDGEILRPLMERMARLGEEHDLVGFVPGSLQERFGPDRFYVEVGATRWFCTGLGHCHVGAEDLPRAVAPNWVFFQWRPREAGRDPVGAWVAMIAEWVEDRWVIRYQSWCNWYETQWGEAIPQIFGIELEDPVTCPPNPRADDPVRLHTVAMGFDPSLASDALNY